tara:strand:+ start:80688 stop:81527 length:840 start_codon:yes stop_codon:yes gene_type:complete
MKNILIPIDFSTNATKALEYALVFFKNTSCNFYILHVLTNSNYITTDSFAISTSQIIEKTLVKNTKIRLQNLLLKIKRSFPNSNHNFIPLVTTDYFIDSIRTQVKEKKITLLVMGTKGASGIKEIIVGSNTGDVITKVKIPLLAIPENAQFTPPKEIAFPTDYNLFYQTKVLNDISAFTTMYDATLRILHVRKKEEELSAFQKENKEYLSDYFTEFNHSFHRITNKKIEAGVQCFVESRDINMLVMIAKNLNLFQQIIFKPTVKEISYHTTVPLLVLHE